MIQLENIDFSYHTRPILKDVNLTVSKKECIGIIGPNGGGKTTLLKLILGFLKPKRGHIAVLGKSPKGARQHLSYVPQRGNFEQDFPIYVEDVVLGGRLSHSPWLFSKKDRSKVREVLERLDISSFANEPLGSLSGGLMQRVLIARALVAEPDILLLDEPTANIDTKTQSKIFEIIQELRKEITILMVTHHLESVFHLVDRVWTVEGRIESLDPKDVCKHFVMGLYHTPLLDLESP